MEFYPYYHRMPLANTSNEFNIYRWNATGRKNAANERSADDKRGIAHLQLQFRTVTSRLDSR